MKWYKLLGDYVRRNGPIPTVRVSSAQASGFAKKFNYWGTVRYEIRFARDGRLINKALNRASSDRRSYRLAVDDACKTGRLRLQTIGEIDDEEAKDILTFLLAAPTATA